MDPEERHRAEVEAAEERMRRRDEKRRLARTAAERFQERGIADGDIVRMRLPDGTETQGKISVKFEGENVAVWVEPFDGHPATRSS